LLAEPDGEGSRTLPAVPPDDLFTEPHPIIKSRLGIFSIHARFVAPWSARISGGDALPASVSSINYDFGLLAS
jgi:hypothetical protein